MAPHFNPGELKVISSRLHYIPNSLNQCKGIVKMHGVYASHYIYSVFARKLQIRYFHPRDSGEIVKPFSQVINKMTMDFATLEPSGIQLPFTGAYSFPSYRIALHITAPGRPHNLYNIFTI